MTDSNHPTPPEAAAQKTRPFDGATQTTRPFGTSERAVAAVGQGTWKIEQHGKSSVVDALRKGLDLGLTHIDTAEMYGSGAAERIVGKAIAGRRDEVFLVSKVLPSNASERGTRKACEATLARLGTDHLDCYLLHWRGEYALAETVAGFERLKQDGKILAWGVSNFDVADLEEVTAVAGAVPCCNQALYHLQERAIEHGVLPWCAAHGTALVAYTPLGQSTAPYDGRTDASRILLEIAAAHGATPRQVALAFLLEAPQVFVIPKAANPEHLRENAGAAAVELSPADHERLDTAFPRGSRRSLPML
jgi:diketogulonate reductase-like aldo/keto reductase